MSPRPTPVAGHVPWWVAAATGTVGAAAVAVASYRAGPYRLTHGGPVPTLDPVRTGRALAHDHAPWLLYFGGVVLLGLAFLLVGREVLGGGGRPATAAVRRLLLCAGLWAAPLLFAAPVASRDVWAYLAQGEVWAHHLDPYRVGPAAVHGPYLRAAGPGWRHTPAPYGPLFLLIARVAVTIAGHHVYAAVTLIRVLTFAAWALTVALIPALCRALGARVDVALWLFALNPLVLVIAVGGSHNDVLMTGLIAVALWLAVRDRPPGASMTRTLVPAAVVLTVAAEVKAPALIVLAFLPWLRRRAAHRAGDATGADGAAVVAPPPPARDQLRAWGAVVVGAVLTAVAVQVATGLGVGWIGRLGSVDIGISWLSVPDALVRAGEYLRGYVAIRVNAHTHTGALVATISSLLAAGVLAPLWWQARTRPAMLRLALALAAAIVCSTSVQPWYFCWPLLVAGFVVLPPAMLTALAVASVGVTVGMEPSGLSVLDTRTGMCVLALTAAASWVVLQLRPPGARPVLPDAAPGSGPAQPRADVVDDGAGSGPIQRR